MKIERREYTRYTLLLPPGKNGEPRELTITTYGSDFDLTYEEVLAMQRGLDACGQPQARVPADRKDES